MEQSVRGKEAWRFLRDRTVLVTGGGGTVGSELCRTVAGAGIKRLVIADIYENNAYETEQELKRHFPALALDVCIASVRDKTAMKKLFARFRPDIVFHAAAHKHVPLMEACPGEAVKNNVFGTLNCVRLAGEYGAQTFVLISTDKAAAPASVMGATKRVCEMIVQAAGERSAHTKFVSVRFGNVWGSNGSVVPLFEKEIAEGGPVTVTDPEATRYFMTAAEAARLVLQAGAYAANGETYMLDMGEPVRIGDVAEELIRRAGREIAVVYTGLRPGEKLHEERPEACGLTDTPVEGVKLVPKRAFDGEEFFRRLKKLRRAVNASPQTVRALLKELVPGYGAN